MEREAVVPAISRELARISRNYLPAGNGSPISTVSELSRLTGVNPNTILRTIAERKVSFSNNGGGQRVAIVDGQLPEDKPRDTVSKITAPRRSRFYDRTAAKIYGEKQRYERRFQFPNGGKGKTVRRRIESCVAIEQILKTRIKLVSPSDIISPVEAKWATRSLGKKNLEIPPANLSEIMLNSLKRGTPERTILERELKQFEARDQIDIFSEKARLTDVVSRSLLSKFTQEELKSFRSVVGIPVVGFGGQSPITNRTLPELMKQNAEKCLYVFFVNWPEGQNPDGTGAKIRKVLKDSALEKTSTVLSDKVLLPVAMGNIRSAIFDGFNTVAGASISKLSGELTFIVLDDDFVLIPNDWIKGSTDLLARNPKIDLVASEVMFDSPEQPTKAVRGFQETEITRSLAARKLLSFLTEISKSNEVYDDKQLERIAKTVFAKKIEGIFYSGFAIRASAYKEIGGFIPRDEISRTIRQICLLGLSKGQLNLSTSRQTLVCDSRRALATYIKDGLPSVQQWQGRYKFKTDEVDPARKFIQGATYSLRPYSDNRIRQQIETVFDYFDLGFAERREILEKLSK